MIEDIQPALTPEQWKTVPAKWELERESEGPLRGITISYTDGDFWYGEVRSPLTPAQAIALVNYALPDEDARKITLDDVEALREAAEQLRGLMERFKAELTSQPFFDPIAGLSRSQIRLDRLASRLASLLPPPPLTKPFTVIRIGETPPQEYGGGRKPLPIRRARSRRRLYSA